MNQALSDYDAAYDHAQEQGANMIDKAKHTPGPWDNRSRVLTVRHTASGDCIADIGGRCFNEDRANARLIAAAPDMLAALQGVMSYWHLISADQDEDVTIDQRLPAVREAIRKATTTD